MMKPEQAYERLCIGEWNFSVGSDPADNSLMIELEEYGRRCAAVCFADIYSYLNVGIDTDKNGELCVYALMSDDVFRSFSLLQIFREEAAYNKDTLIKIKLLLDQALSEST